MRNRTPLTDAKTIPSGRLPARATSDGEPHPTAMIERPGPVLRWFFQRFFREIAFPDEAAARVRAAADRGQVVYVCRTLSYIEYLYFTFAFLQRGLPLSRFANGVKTLFLQPLGRIVRGVAFLWRRRHQQHLDEFAEVVQKGHATFLFLKRPQTLFGWEPAGFKGPYVEELIRLQKQRMRGEASGASRDASERAVPARMPASEARPLVFVPMVLLWGSPALRAARTRKGLIDIVFGDREAPGRLRQMYLFFRHFAESQVVASEPIDLRAFLAQEGEQPEEVLARRLRWQLTGRLESEVRVVLGPVRKGKGRIQEEVLRSRKLVAEAQAIARDENIAQEELVRRAAHALEEIAADPKPWAFDVLKPFFGWVHRRIFDGLDIDEAGLERVRAAAHQGPLLLVPSHKSHIDYLVVSYVLSENDLVPPHIAAGANLSFFPLGPLFRRAGAFFLRRSFKGDRLYGAVFRAYIRKLLREGYSVEFFIEGGRSRTGKLLGPKLGLLGMVVEAALADDGAQARRAHVVPISIGYEKVIEEKSYARELAGGEKKKEDVRGLLKATRVLSGNYGRLNIQFDEPFPLGAALRDLGALVAWDENENVVVPADPAVWRLATQRLAHRIVWGINRVTAVTPTALAACALLAPGRRGISRTELIGNARRLLAWARAVGGRLSPTVADLRTGALNQEALDRALDLLSRDRDIEVRSGSGTLPGGGRPLDEIYTIPDDRRPRLAFYRNNAVHLYVDRALVALALLSSVPRAQGAELVIARSLLRERTLQLSRLLKLEFAFRVGETFDSIFEATVRAMVDARLLESEVIGDATSALRAASVGELQLLAGLVRDLVEAYWVAARALETLEAPVARKELVRRIHELGDSLFFTSELTRREACIDANYHNAIAAFVERRILVEEERKVRVAPGADVKALAAEIRALLPVE